MVMLLNATAVDTPKLFVTHLGLDEPELLPMVHVPVAVHCDGEHSKSFVKPRKAQLDGVVHATAAVALAGQYAPVGQMTDVAGVAQYVPASHAPPAAVDPAGQ